MAGLWIRICSTSAYPDHLKCPAVKSESLTNEVFNPPLGDLQSGFNELCGKVAYIKPKRKVESLSCTLQPSVFWLKGPI